MRQFDSNRHNKRDRLAAWTDFNESVQAMVEADMSGQLCPNDILACTALVDAYCGLAIEDDKNRTRNGVIYFCHAMSFFADVLETMPDEVSRETAKGVLRNIADQHYVDTPHGMVWAERRKLMSTNMVLTEQEQKILYVVASTEPEFRCKAWLAAVTGWDVIDQLACQRKFITLGILHADSEPCPSEPNFEKGERH